MAEVLLSTRRLAWSKVVPLVAYEAARAVSVRTHNRHDVWKALVDNGVPIRVPSMYGIDTPASHATTLIEDPEHTAVLLNG